MYKRVYFKTLTPFYTTKGYLSGGNRTHEVRLCYQANIQMGMKSLPLAATHVGLAYQVNGSWGCCARGPRFKSRGNHHDFGAMSIFITRV